MRAFPDSAALLPLLVVAAACGPAPATDAPVDSDAPVHTGGDTAAVETDGADTDTDAPVDFLAPPEAVAFEAGTYTLGSPDGQIGHTDVEALHRVTLTYRFEVATTEVTQGQLAARLPELEASSWAGCPRCPTERVSWHVAAAFANALSDAGGLEACYACADGEDGRPVCHAAMAPWDCDGWRLPTEAEWEIAARAGGAHAGGTPGGGDLPDEDAADACADPLPLDDGTSLGDQAWFCGNFDARPGHTTRPVGTRAPNAAGLYDVLGNVWEWTNDGWTDVLVDATDPFGTPAAETNVVRGGGWNSLPRQTRLAARTLAAPGTRVDNLGFRLARTLATP